MTRTFLFAPFAVALLACGGGDDDTNDNTSILCGNGVLEGSELCDEGSANSDTAPNACRTNCVPAGCGDGVADADEECDGDDLRQTICADLPDLTHGTLARTEQCEYDLSTCYGCGNGILEPEEDCDATAFGTATCQTEADVPDGELACTAQCTIDATGWGANNLLEQPCTSPGAQAVIASGFGAHHTCVGSDVPDCWGHNDHGQLGTSTTVSSCNPATASVVSGVTQLSAGLGYTCVVRSDGSAQCWGANDYGQLGDGTAVDSLTPLDLP